MNTIKDKAAYNTFDDYFAHISDPRQAHKIKHLLSEILFMIVLAVIAGADDFHEIEQYAKEKYKWLSTFLKLPAGIPSHDTFNRVLCMIDAEQFQQSFIDWVSDIRNSIKAPKEKDIINIDGKTVCNSKDETNGKKAIHMVSALSTEYGLVLGQQKCHEKSNEITAIPALLTMLLIEGSVITIDAMGCQKDIASIIIKGKADYILALKGNQGNLLKEVIDLFEKAKTPEFAHYVHQTDIQLEKNHGRIEKRECVTINNLDWLFEIKEWKGVRSIAKITATVFKKGKETKEERYYISSLPGNAEFINRAVRKHWHIENKLHWILDVIFKEDYSRVRTGNGAENLTTVRKIALNAFKRDTSQKTSLKNKRKKASWNDAYAVQILSNMKA
jgi:predicted transposase YbfD/YdcC